MLLPYMPDAYLSISSEDKAIFSIIGINAIVFVGWRLFPLFMMRHFIQLSGDKRAYTLLTSSFSHQDLWHLGFNMVALYSLGKFLYKFIGKEDFFALYLSSAVVSAFCSRVNMLIANRFMSSLGASGAIYSSIGVLYTFFPQATLMLFFVIPAQASVLIPGLFIFEVLGLFGFWRKAIPIAFDHAAHLGGFITGLAYSQYLYNKKRKRRVPMATR